MNEVTVVLGSMNELCSGDGRYDGNNEMTELSEAIPQSTHHGTRYKA